MKQKEASPPPFIKNPKYLLDGFRRGRACSSRNHQEIKTTRKGVGSTPPVLKKHQVTDSFVSTLSG